jgi:hypothetical protein
MRACLFTIMLLAGCATVPPNVGDSISEAELRQTIAVLSSDEFEGRAPGTAGEAKTIAYLADRFRSAGLVSGARGDKPFLDPVPLIRVEHGLDGISLRSPDGREIALARTEAFAATRGEAVAIRDAPLLFVGYGVGADGELVAGIAGKVVILLGENPPFLSERLADRRQASRREYDLLKGGALAVLGLYRAPAEAQARAIESGRTTNWSRRFLRWAGDEGRWEVRGGIASDRLGSLLRGSGVDLQTLVKQAGDPAFKPAILPWRVSINQQNRSTPMTSYNVVGKLRGARPDGKVVLMLAHWDHLGICRPEGESDRICNGAVDNGSGLAAMFIATTAEEQTLQGAYALIGDPPFPLTSMVAGFNLDTIAIGTRGAKVSTVAADGSYLPALVREVATAQGKTYVEPGDAQSFISRQDGWAFVQQGLPIAFAGSSFTDPARLAAYLRSPYHGPDDELTEGTDLSGAAADAELHLELIRRAASRSFSPPR